VQLARLLFAAALIVLAGLTPARATPMLLVDMETLEVLYEQEAGQPWHPASLTKLMTAYVTFEAIAAGRIALDTVITLSKAAVGQAPSSSGLKVGSSITLRDALYVLVVHSANDIAWAIAEAVGGRSDE
jgi:D-alanyl-D-alanine carboxypeptidase